MYEVLLSCVFIISISVSAYNTPEILKLCFFEHIGKFTAIFLCRARVTKGFLDSIFLDNVLDIPSELISSQIMPALRYLERDSREYATDVHVSRLMSTMTGAS